MMRRFPASVAFGALLGSTAVLSPLSALAQTAPAANPPQAVAPPSPAQVAPAQRKPGTDDRTATDAKAMGALKAFFDAKLAGLHAGLELTPEQAPLWTPVEAAIRDLAKAHTAAHRDRGDAEPSDALGQLKRLSEQLIRGGRAMKALADATGPLLTTLSDDQKERLPKLLEGMQPKKVLAKAFNLPGERDADHGERDSEDGQRGYEHHRHHEEADEDHGPRHGHGEEGRSDDGQDRDFEGRDRDGRDYGNRDSDNHDFGDRFYRDHDGRGDRHRGEDRETERQHDGHPDHDDSDRDHHRPDGFHHRQDNDDERT